MFNEILGHKRLSLLICYLTVTPAVQMLLLEWQVGESAKSSLSQATNKVCSLRLALKVAFTYGSSVT